MNKIFLILPFLCLVYSSYCPYDCYNNGKCVWVYKPHQQHGRGNFTSLICDCNKGYYGPFCNQTIIDTDEEKKIEEKVEEDAENFIKNQIIYICIGVVGGLAIIVGSVVYYCRKKREKLLRDVYEEKDDKYNNIKSSTFHEMNNL